MFLLLFPVFAFTKEKRNPFIINNVEIAYNFPINQNAYDFFDAFNQYSNLSADEFTFRNFPSVSFDIEIPNLTNFVLNLDWINLLYSTNFNKKSSYSFNSFFRSYSESFDFNFLPITLSFFITPFDTDFKTQLHFQFGVSYDRLEWKEFVGSELDDDPRKGLETIRIKQFSPLFAFGIRNVLPFDILDREQLLNFFFFEAKFYFMYRNIDIFTRISKYEPIPEKVTILPFSIVFIIGVNFKTRSFFNK
ncbi:MAG: hypothetical protein ACP5RR_02575 [Candidatus Kapaibacteriota bacterium]